MIKVLIIQLGSPANLLLSTLLIRCLKQSGKEVELHYLLHHSHAHVLATNPYIDHIHQLHFNRQTTLHELKPQSFDYVWDLEQEGDASAWVHELGAHQPKKKQKGWKAFLKIFFQSNKESHGAEHYLENANDISVANDDWGLDFFIPKESEVSYKDIPASHQAGYILLALDVEGAYAWPYFMLEAICHQIDHPIILAGTRGSAALAEEIKSKVGIKMYNACGKFSSYETADLLRKAKLLVAFQPYYIQLAAALKKEVVIPDVKVVGSNDPYYGQKHLKALSFKPFDKVTVHPQLFLNKEIEARSTNLQKEGERAITQIVQTVTKRLRSKD